MPTLPRKERNVICNTYGNYCFNEMMNEISLSRNCSCLPTCHHIEFTYIEEKIPIDLEMVCYENQASRVNSQVEVKTIVRDIGNVLMENGYNSLAYNFFEYKNLKIRKQSNPLINDTFGTWNKETINSILCGKIVKHLAIVTVMFDKDTYVRTKTSLRVSSSDKLAAFGKFFEWPVY